MTTKYMRLKDVKDVINQEVISDVMKTGHSICCIRYKVIHGVLVMVSNDRVVKFDIDGTIKIIRQLMKDSKRKYNFNDRVLFTYAIPTLTELA